MVCLLHDGDGLMQELCAARTRPSTALMLEIHILMFPPFFPDLNLGE